MGSLGPEFPIPPQFQKDVCFSPSNDLRSDEEIVASLNQFQPVTSEKNIWAFWNTGITTMNGWQQRNVIGWVRKMSPEWTIRVIDSQPDSPNYALNYFPADQVPACFRDGTMDGTHVGQHSADFMRGAALYCHGGIWADVGIIFLMHPNRFCWDQLEDPNSPFQICIPSINNAFIGNWFVAARKGDPFIQRWHEIFCKVWENRTHQEGISEHPLFANMGLDWDDAGLWEVKLELKVKPRLLLEYGAQIICWMRMCMITGSQDPKGDQFNGNEYWNNKVLVIDAPSENMGSASVLGFEDIGAKQFKAWSTRLDADPTTDDYLVAFTLAWRILAGSVFEKVARAKDMTKGLNLGSIWDLPENEGKDKEPGTFAQLLRYASINFDQIRTEIGYVKPGPPPHLLKLGALEE